jgi:hypothetical protein
MGEDSSLIANLQCFQLDKVFDFTTVKIKTDGRNAKNFSCRRE